MTKLIFASNNESKVLEIKSLLDGGYQILSLKEAGIVKEIPEPFDSLEKNAAEKSRVIFEITKSNCFSEDTGLEIEELDGAPGVYSARYAGEPVNNRKNIELVLKNMSSAKNRMANFRTVISLIFDEKEYFFEGICDGYITQEERGSNGFGYDAIFVPTGESKTFAEMNLEEKNKFSHRKKAFTKLIEFLNTYNGKA